MLHLLDMSGCPTRPHMSMYLITFLYPVRRHWLALVVCFSFVGRTFLWPSWRQPRSPRHLPWNQARHNSRQPKKAELPSENLQHRIPLSLQVHRTPFATSPRTLPSVFDVWSMVSDSLQSLLTWVESWFWAWAYIFRYSVPSVPRGVPSRIWVVPTTNPIFAILHKGVPSKNEYLLLIIQFFLLLLCL